jgi:fatty acid desaturase
MSSAPRSAAPGPSTTSVDAAASADASAVDIGSADMGTAALPGRNVLDIEIVRSLSHRSDVRGLLRFGAHLCWLVATGSLVWLSRATWYLLIPAMALHGCVIVTMFAPMHECVHYTAFKSRRLNDIFGWIAGTLCFYNSTYFRRYHTWHHRYTQDHERDPELATPKPRSLFNYVVHISGLPFWMWKPRELTGIAAGHLARYPYIPPQARRETTLSGAAQMAVYVGAFAYSVAFGSTFFLYYWLLPAILGQPLLRAILIVEHTGCSEDSNGLTNTRTTLTMWPVRLLMWNMPFHAEHHLYPSIPFHQLPHAHQQLANNLTHLAPSYVAANQSVIRSLRMDPQRGELERV